MFWGRGRNSYCVDRCREARWILSMMRKHGPRCLKCPQSSSLWQRLWAPIHPQSLTFSTRTLTASVSSTTLHCDLLGRVGETPALAWLCQSNVEFEAEPWFHEVKCHCINSLCHLMLAPPQLQNELLQSRFTGLAEPAEHVSLSED